MSTRRWSIFSFFGPGRHPAAFQGNSRRALVLALCLLVGAAAGLASVAMHGLAAWCGELQARWQGCLSSGQAQWLAPMPALVAILLCVAFAQLFFRKRGYEKSLWPAIREARSAHGGLKLYNAFTHILTSGLCVGMGISAGMEAPSALTGAAIGVNAGRAMGLSRDTNRLLLCAGAAGGIAAIFNAPLAGTLFVCEVLLPNVNAVLLIPLLAAAAAGSVVARAFGLALSFPSITYAWRMENLGFYLLIGAVCGLTAAGVIRLNCLFTRLSGGPLRAPWTRALIFCVLLLLAFLAFPLLRGQGYGFISLILQHDTDALPTGLLPDGATLQPGTALLLAAAVVLLKPVASMLSLHAGGDGGMFGPSLVTGAFLGYFFNTLLNLLNLTGFPMINCVVAGMAGLLAGVMHAPLTGLFLIAEMVGGYRLFVPLMLVVSMATFVSRLLTRGNPYASAVIDAAARQGASPDDDGTVASLTELEETHVGELADRRYLSLEATDSFRKLLQVLLHSRQAVFPVVDASGALVGLVREQHIRPHVLDARLYDTLIVDDLMGPPPPSLPEEAPVREANALFDHSHEPFLPVTRKGKFLGMLSREHLLENYRQFIENHELF